MDAQSIAANIAFTTSGSLVDCVDKKIVVLLRDGRKYIGVLRSYDQFANLALQDTVERVFAGNHYADVPTGTLVVRGENVVLVGEIDLDEEDDPPAPNAVPTSLETPLSAADVVGSLSLYPSLNPVSLPPSLQPRSLNPSQAPLGAPPQSTRDQQSSIVYPKPLPPPHFAAVMKAAAKEKEASAARQARKVELLRSEYGFCEEGADGDQY